MKVELQYQPFGAMAKLLLDEQEAVQVEPGALIGMSANVDVQTSARGGILKSVGRMFGGENFFQNTFTAKNGPAEVLVSQRLPGDMIALEVPQHGLRLTSTSYVAGHRDLEIQTKFSGLKTLFSGEGLFTMQARATAPNQTIILGAYGGITEMVCDGSIVIDSGHLVAWDAQLEYMPQKAGSGWMSSFFSGEGIVVGFRGEGRIWMQSRNPVAYGVAIGSRLPPRQS